MTNSKTTRRALVLSLLSLLLCCSMLVGTTFAWFTDSVTSGRNQIVAGNLDIVLEYWDGNSFEAVDATTKLFPDEALWEPGHTEIAYLRVNNAGTLALKYQLDVNVYEEIGGINVDGDSFLLSDNLVFKVLDIDEVDVGSYDRDSAKLEAGTVMGLDATQNGDIYNGDTRELEPKDAAGTTNFEDFVALIIYMPETVGNWANYKTGTTPPSIEMGVELLATQQTYEEDSFDDLYDAEAGYLYVSGYQAVPTAAAEPMVLSTSAVSVELPAEFLNDLPDEVEMLQLVHTAAKMNAASREIKFDSVDIVDQDGNKVDLEAVGNTKPYVATLPVQGFFAPGERVYVYHDGELIDTVMVNADGTITYEALHFCEVVISDTRMVKIHSAEEFIAVLTEIKTEAKKQIPGETGNKNYREKVSFILENDIVIDGDTAFMYTDSNGAPLHFYGVKGVLDLNGHDITVTADALMDGKAYANAVLLVQYSNINIVGDGSIIANNKSIPVFGWANGSVNIYGGTYITNAYERNESDIYVNNASMVIHVYGGNFSTYAFNAHDTNCGSNTVMVLHEGVTYKQFLKNGSVDVIASDLAAGRLQIADGCVLEETVVDGETWYQVVEE